MSDSNQKFCIPWLVTSTPAIFTGNNLAVPNLGKFTSGLWSTIIRAPWLGSIRMAVPCRGILNLTKRVGTLDGFVNFANCNKNSMLFYVQTTSIQAWIYWLIPLTGRILYSAVRSPTLVTPYVTISIALLSFSMKLMHRSIRGTFLLSSSCTSSFGIPSLISCAITWLVCWTLFAVWKKTHAKRELAIHVIIRVES